MLYTRVSFGVCVVLDQKSWDKHQRTSEINGISRKHRDNAQANRKYRNLRTSEIDPITYPYTVILEKRWLLLDKREMAVEHIKKKPGHEGERRKRRERKINRDSNIITNIQRQKGISQSLCVLCVTHWDVRYKDGFQPWKNKETKQMAYPNKNIQINKWTTEGKKKKKNSSRTNPASIYIERERERESQSQ